MAREFRILSRLPDALPFIARGLHLCDDPSVIGQRFQIIEYRPGLVIRERMPAGTGAPSGGRRAAVEGACWKPSPPSTPWTPRPSAWTIWAGRRASWRAASSGWRKRGLAAKEDGTDALHHDIGTWLERNIVPDGPPGLLHNDFKLNNMILDPDDFSPRAVVDWDQGTRGDPLFDFATLLTYWVHADDPQPMHDMEQMPAVEACLCSRQEAVAEYARISGRDVSDFLFYRVLAMYKLAVIFLQLGLRYRTGATAEPRYAPLTGIGTGILEFTHEIAQGRAF